MKNNGTILLVDDDLDDQEIFRLALAEVDDSIFIITAASGVEALDRLKTEQLRPDCIFLDLNMPRMSGKQCLKLIKAEPNLVHIPVIIYSTSAEIRDIEETNALGAAAFITKPAIIQDLVTSLQNVLLRLH